MKAGTIHLRRFFLDRAIGDERLCAVLADCCGMARKDVSVIADVEDLVGTPDGDLAILRFRHPGTPFPVSIEIYPPGGTDQRLPCRSMEDFAVRLAKALSARILTDDDATLDPYCGLLFGDDGVIAEVDMHLDEATGEDVIEVRHRRYRRPPADQGTS